MLKDFRTVTSNLFGEPYTMPTIVVEVDLSKTTNMLGEYARILFNEANRVAGVHDKDLFEVEEMVKYLQTVLWIRVCSVNSVLKRDYYPVSRMAHIPILWAAVLELVGIANDVDFGISFKPKFEISSDKLMSPSEAMDFSRKLGSIERNGFKQTTTGIGRQPEGDVGFMAMCHLENVVVSYRRDHPMYGFFSSFFQLQTLDSITGLKPRIIYGSKDQFQLYLSTLTSTSG